MILGKSFCFCDTEEAIAVWGPRNDVSHEAAGRAIRSLGSQGLSLDRHPRLLP